MIYSPLYRIRPGGYIVRREKKFRHLTKNDRLNIERLLLAKWHKKDIAMAVGCSLRTIYYEIARSKYVHTNWDYTEEVRYNPDGADERARQFLSQKGRRPILEEDPKLCSWISMMIISQKYSPEACVLELKKNDALKDIFKVEVRSANTVYTAIRKGLIPFVTMATLPRKGKSGRGKKKVTVQKRVSAGKSIEKRPAEVDTRETFGHWEGDTVKGKKGNEKCIFVLTERKTRYEIMEPLKNGSAAEVRKALNRIEKRFNAGFYNVFKTITVDNGSEFSDPESMEKALNRVGKRTEVYFCHPRSPEERGSNENNNHMVRRKFPKGTDFDKVLTRNNVKECEEWINLYPRGILEGHNAHERFEKELLSLGIRYG